MGRGLDSDLAVKVKDGFKTVRWHLDLQHGVATLEKPGEHLTRYSVLFALCWDALRLRQIQHKRLRARAIPGAGAATWTSMRSWRAPPFTCP